MGTQGAALADQFEQAVSEFAKTIEGLSEEQWCATCNDEGWTVAGTAQHVSGQFGLEKEFISAAAEGRELPSYTWKDINEKNDTRAEANMNCSKADVLKQLREDGAAMAQYVRGLSDEQLARSGALGLANGATVSTQQLIEGGVLIDHVRGHLKSIRAACP